MSKKLSTTAGFVRQARTYKNGEDQSWENIKELAEQFNNLNVDELSCKEALKICKLINDVCDVMRANTHDPVAFFDLSTHAALFVRAANHAASKELYDVKCCHCGHTRPPANTSSLNAA